MQKKQTPIDNKLTLVSITRHGRIHSFFIKLPIYEKEKAVISKRQLDEIAFEKLKCPLYGSYTTG